MGLHRLKDHVLDTWWKHAEAAMGLQVAISNGKLVFVVGDEAVFDPHTPHNAGQRQLEEAWFRASLSEDQAGLVQAGLSALETWDEPLDRVDPQALRAVVWPGPTGTTPPTPALGHLPYQGNPSGNDLFYRWEPWPTSRRVLRQGSSHRVTHGTFAAPESEVRFVACGFGAVGRFALPQVAPACFRWALQPPSSTRFRCGASVPLFGQAGGGVEVEFTTGFTNVGPVPPAVVLPAL